MRFVVLALAVSAAAAGCRRQADAPDVRERAYQANNRGVALLEQFRYDEAAQAFREALAIDASVAIARHNLSLALLYSQDLSGAAREAAEAARLLPSAPQPPYVLGLIARAENRTDDALRQFERVRQIDPVDVGAGVNLGQIYLEERRYADAIAVLQPAAAAEPYNVTAAYNLGLALTRGGQADEGRDMLGRAQSLRTTGYSITYGTGYLEQGRYAEAMVSTGAEPELVNADPPSLSFVRSEIPLAAATPPDASPVGRRFTAADLDGAGVQRLVSALAGAVALFDRDGDGDLDLFVASGGIERLFANLGGQFVDVTEAAGLGRVPPASVAVGAVAADYDNDRAADLFVLRSGASSLYRNDGSGRFTDVTSPAALPRFGALPGAAAFSDVDHDGDVDLIVAGLADIEATRRRAGQNALIFPSEFAAAPLRLLRNNGNGTFADVTAAAGLQQLVQATAIVPSDFDNRRDVDLLVVNANGPPLLYQNRRDGTFQDVAAAAGLAAALSAGATAVATADVNKDDFPDFYFTGSGGGALVLSQRTGRYAAAEAPGGAAGATAVQLADYDNDGVTDLFEWTPDGPRVYRNLGSRWSDESARAFRSPAAAAPNPRAMALGDLDGDGAIDVVTAAGGVVSIWRASVTGGAAASQRVNLLGRVSNRSAVGSKVQLRAGSLSTRLETSATTPPVAPASIVFGLGRRSGADTVRVLWPSGILQAETLPALPASPALTVEELDRKPSSCPFLFTWNGDRFEFVTDFLGAGEMGYWQAPGQRSQPDPIEYVRVRGGQLQPRGGRFELRVTNELEEALFIDRLQLLAIDHPDGVGVYPNEGMTAPPKPFGLFAVADERVPRAIDDHGHDVTDRVARVDRRYPDDFALERIRGYAAAHTLTLDLAPMAPGAWGPPSGGPVLLLTGWTDYAFSSDNVAAHQAGLVLTPPALQVKDAAGRWRTAIEQIGIPVGRPQTVTVDLSDHLRPGEHEVRIVTSMRVYWDRIAVGRKAVGADLQMTRLDPIGATLRSRGFSAEVRPGGTEPPTYDYSRVSTISPWKVMAGRYTREGDVRELLIGSDDMFAIGRPGDEISVQFDAGLPPLLAGRARTFLLFADGYSKEMDINSATPDFVEPLPFHRMTAYPYPAGEHYPETPGHHRYRETFNTRVVVRPIPPVDAASR